MRLWNRTEPGSGRPGWFKAVGVHSGGLHATEPATKGDIMMAIEDVQFFLIRLGLILSTDSIVNERAVAVVRL